MSVFLAASLQYDLAGPLDLSSFRGPCCHLAMLLPVPTQPPHLNWGVLPDAQITLLGWYFVF